MITIIGSFVSPYVRKVLACLNLKGIAMRSTRSRRSSAMTRSNG